MFKSDPFAFARRPTPRHPAKPGASIESLECRTLLSAYSFSQAATFGTSFGNPSNGVAMDTSGNLFGIAGSGGANNTGGIYELASGAAAPALAASFPAGAQVALSSGLAVSGGNVFGLAATITPTEDVFVYELPAGGSSIQTVADLGDVSISQFAGSLLIDSTGNIFGTTISGGTNRQGEIFEVPHGASTPTILASFPNVGSNGIPGTLTPDEDLVEDSVGDLFGSTSGTGSFGTGNGTIYELAKNSANITTTYTFDGTTTGSAPTGLVMDANGDLFGNTMNNSSFSHTALGGIFELPHGATTPTVLATFTQPTGNNSFWRPTIDAAGDLFGAAEYGGQTSSFADGDGVIFELPAGSHTITAIHTFGGSEGESPVGNVVLDANGNVFGAAGGPGQSGHGLIFKLAPGGGAGGDGGSGSITPAITGKLPASTIAGQKINASQTVTLTASAAVNGTVGGAFFLDAATTVDASAIRLGSVSKKLKLKAGAHAAFNFKLASPPSTVPDGTYHVVVQVTDPSGNITYAASTATITVAPPEIDLSGAFANAPANAKAGKKTPISFTVTNSGNVPAVGTLPLTIETSPDANPADATPLLSVGKKINLKPGKPLKITLPIVLPAGSYALIVLIDPGNTFSDVNPANNTLTSGILTVS